MGMVPKGVTIAFFGNYSPLVIGWFVLLSALVLWSAYADWKYNELYQDTRGVHLPWWDRGGRTRTLLEPQADVRLEHLRTRAIRRWALTIAGMFVAGILIVVLR